MTSCDLPPLLFQDVLRGDGGGIALYSANLYTNIAYNRLSSSATIRSSTFYRNSGAQVRDRW